MWENEKCQVTQCCKEHIAEDESDFFFFCDKITYFVDRGDSRGCDIFTYIRVLPVSDFTFWQITLEKTVQNTFMDYIG